MPNYERKLGYEGKLGSLYGTVGLIWGIVQGAFLCEYLIPEPTTPLAVSSGHLIITGSAVISGILGILIGSSAGKWIDKRKENKLEKIINKDLNMNREIKG